MTVLSKKQSYLLASVSIISLAATLPVVSHAAAYSTNGGDITTTQTLTATELGLSTNNNDLTVTGGNAVNVDASATGATVQVDTVSKILTTTTGVGVNVVAGADSTTITVGANGNSAIIDTADEAIVLGGTATSITASNDGLIQAGAGKTVVDLNAATTLIKLEGSSKINAQGAGVGLDVGANLTNLDLDSTASIVTASGTALNISGASTMEIDLANGTAIDGGTGTAINVDAAVTGTLTNEGTISVSDDGTAIMFGASGSFSGGIANTEVIETNTAAGTAIDNSASSTALTIVNSANGAITGQIKMGSGGDTLTHSSSGAVTGAITGGSGDDTITASGSGAVVGNVDLAGGADTITISSTGGITGTVDLGTGDDTMTISADTPNVLAIDGGAGTDSLEVSAGTFTTGGAITNVETVKTSGTGAVSLGHSVTGATITHGGSGSFVQTAGTISGVTFSNGSGAGSFAGTVTQTGGTAIDASANKTARTYTLSTATVTGDIKLGTAGDTLNITGASTVTGAIAGGAGSDTLDLDESFATAGDVSAIEVIDVAAGKTLTANNAISGVTTTTVQTGSTLKVASGGSIDGNIAGVGAAVLDLDTDFTAAGTITDIETLDIAAGKTFKTGGAISGLNTAINIGADSVVNLDHTVAGTSAITSSGDISIASGKVFNGATIAQTGGVITFEGTAASVGQIALTGAATIALDGTTKVQATIKAVDGQAITAGNYTVIDGGSNIVGAANYELVDNSWVYTLTDASTAQDVIIKVARGNGLATAGGNTAGVGTTAEALSVAGGLTGTLATAITNVENAATKTAAKEALEILAPTVDGGSVAGTMAASNQSIGTVEGRLASLRNAKSGIATGDAAVEKAMWIQAFGQSADGDARKGVAGFDSSTVGFAIGFDTEIDSQTTLGVSGSYATTDVDSLNSDTDVDSLQFNIYGSHEVDANWFVDGLFGVSLNDYDSKRRVAGATAAGEYDGTQWTAKATAGYKMPRSDDWQVTPFGSLQYSNLSLDDYTETGAGTANLTVDNKSLSNLKAGFGVKTAYDGKFEGMRFVPEFRAQVLYDIISDEQETTSTFNGGGAAFTTKGITPARTSFNLGTGASLMTDDNLTIKVNYDFETREDYSAHSGLVNLRYQW